MVMNARARFFDGRKKDVHCIWLTLKHEMCVYGFLLIVWSIASPRLAYCILKNIYGYSVKMWEEKIETKQNQKKKQSTDEKQATDWETCIDNACDQILESFWLGPTFIFTFRFYYPPHLHLNLSTFYNMFMEWSLSDSWMQIRMKCYSFESEMMRNPTLNPFYAHCMI